MWEPFACWVPHDVHLAKCMWKMKSESVGFAWEERDGVDQGGWKQNES